MKKTETETKTKVTDRERTVLQFLSQGATSHDIAEALTISERTVKFHIGNIIRKLEAKNRTNAVVMAMVRGLLD